MKYLKYISALPIVVMIFSSLTTVWAANSKEVSEACGLVKGLAVEPDDDSQLTFGLMTKDKRHFWVKTKDSAKIAIITMAATSHQEICLEWISDRDATLSNASSFMSLSLNGE